MKAETREQKEFDEFVEFDFTQKIKRLPFVANLLKCVEIAADNPIFAAVLSLDGHFTRCGAFTAEWTGNGAQYSHFAQVLADHTGRTRKDILKSLSNIITNHKAKHRAGHNYTYTNDTATTAPKGSEVIEKHIKYTIDRKRMDEIEKYIVFSFRGNRGKSAEIIERFNNFAEDHADAESDPREREKRKARKKRKLSRIEASKSK